MGLFAVYAGLVLCIPETSRRRPGALASLMPRISIAPRARPEFLRGLPLLIMVWALCGLLMSLAASLILGVFGVDSGEVNGLAVTVFCGAGAVGPPLLTSYQPSTTATLGMAALAAGLAILLASLSFASVVGAAVAGTGAGLAFSDLVQSFSTVGRSARARGTLRGDLCSNLSSS
jgi:hypothetical protein